MGELSVAQADQFQADLAAGDAPTVAMNGGEQGGEKRGGVLIALSDKTVDHYVGIVKTFMDYLLRAGYLRSNPFFAVEGLSYRGPLVPITVGECAPPSYTSRLVGRWLSAIIVGHVGFRGQSRSTPSVVSAASIRLARRRQSSALAAPSPASQRRLDDSRSSCVISAACIASNSVGMSLLIVLSVVRSRRRPAGLDRPPSVRGGPVGSGHRKWDVDILFETRHEGKLDLRWGAEAKASLRRQAAFSLRPA